MSSLIKLFEDTSDYTLAFRCLRGSIIGLEGLIGAGKTTAVNSIYSFLKRSGLRVKLYKEYINPLLLKQYIQDMKTYSYPFQIIMASKRINTYSDAMKYSETGGIALLDRTLVGDYAFALMQKDNSNITSQEWNVYKSIIEFDASPQPSLIVNFDVDPKVAFKRMKFRNREDEVDGYSLDYFESLKNSYNKVFNNTKSTPLLNIDWNQDQDIVKVDDGYLLPDKTTADILYKIRSKMMSY